MFIFGHELTYLRFWPANLLQTLPKMVCATASRASTPATRTPGCGESTSSLTSWTRKPWCSTSRTSGWGSPPRSPTSKWTGRRTCWRPTCFCSWMGPLPSVRTLAARYVSCPSDLDPKCHQMLNFHRLHTPLNIFLLDALLRTKNATAWTGG